MGVFRVALQAIGDAGRPRTDEALRAQIRDAGGCEVSSIVPERLYFIDGDLTLPVIERVVGQLIVDPVTERAFVATNDAEIAEPTGQLAFEIHPRPGVMDPVAASVLAELRSEGIDVRSVRTARRYVLEGAPDVDAMGRVARLLSNDCVEQVVIGTAGVHPAVQPAARPFRLRHVSVRDLTDPELIELARKGHLFLNLAEMQAIQAHYRALKREPTDLELETIAQTWSEHCVHKTLKTAVQYTGPDFGASCGEVTRQFSNLLKDTIARATDELIAAKRGPTCLSVFKDNAGVIAFDDRFGVAFKVETHNRPSAIEPFGGAATGIGGCIRDVLGCGLGAKPIASTDVFCVAPSDWPEAALPKGVLHPRRVLRGIVDGVGEYGNRMGIPTVNGAVQFDPRYLGNPLVFCGCIGLIPRDRVEKRAQPGDCIVVVGGRTGRDGIHGATFSSGELTDSHADEFSHAVQIGNAIEEKRVLDAVLRAREFRPPGAESAKCLYSAITDCGAGGLSSAVGEMAEELGAVIDLEKAPLKYAGLTYDEIWISEAQERMVLAVPQENLDLLLEVMRS
ncbi:MAG: phosphoribosylformylglycinamidine synthase, partial [Planctomycetes bacterium]|nr:phosphoribosylformylglycinamidine synthase [Planctomycetota bacterium]